MKNLENANFDLIPEREKPVVLGEYFLLKVATEICIFLENSYEVEEGVRKGHPASKLYSTIAVRVANLIGQGTELGKILSLFLVQSSEGEGAIRDIRNQVRKLNERMERLLEDINQTPSIVPDEPFKDLE